MSAVVTRSGRVSKKPERYEPIEQVEDDYSDEEDEDYSDEEDLCETEDEDDADENGNLDGFVVSDEDEDEEEEA
jgi:hypothetical protein